MSGTVLSRTDRHTAHSSGAARSTNALRRATAASPGTTSAAPVVPRPADGERRADPDESDPAAAPSGPVATAAAASGSRADAPVDDAAGSAQPVVPGAALTVTLAIPLTGGALTPEAYRLIEALRDLVERGQGTVTTTAGAPHSAAGDGSRHVPPQDLPGAGDSGPSGGAPRAAAGPAFSGTAVSNAPSSAPTFGQPFSGQPFQGQPFSGPSFPGPGFSDPAFGSPIFSGPPAVAGPTVAGPTVAGPGTACSPVAGQAFTGPATNGSAVAPTVPELADVEWTRPGVHRPVDPAEVRLLTASRQVLLGGVPLAMTRLEFDLLMFLAGNPRRVFTRAQLLGAVWGYEHTGERTVDVHVRRLRVKMGVQVPLITTVYGVGYRLDDDARIVVVAHG